MHKPGVPLVHAHTNTNKHPHTHTHHAIYFDHKCPMSQDSGERTAPLSVSWGSSNSRVWVRRKSAYESTIYGLSSDLGFPPNVIPRWITSKGEGQDNYAVFQDLLTVVLKNKAVDLVKKTACTRTQYICDIDKGVCSFCLYPARFPLQGSFVGTLTLSSIKTYISVPVCCGPAFTRNELGS